MPDATVTEFPQNVEVLSENIPQLLKDLPRWIMWRWVMREGLPTKPPFSAKTGKKADNTSDADWCTFEEAMTALQTGKYSGIGFVPAGRDELVAWDLDRCLDVKTGDIKPWAKSLIDSLGSYTEVTPSGNGLRVLVLGDVPKDGKKRGKLASFVAGKEGVVECYKNKHYITITGIKYFGTPADIRRVDNLEEIWKEIFEKPDNPEVSKLSKNQKAKKLYQGHWDGDYPSQSEADLALCRYLADFTLGDAVKIDHLFRASKLMRAKWDNVHVEGKTYGTTTIEIALASYKRPHSLTDTGDAKRFAGLVGDRVRYCSGNWYVWNDKRLEEDSLYRIYLLMDDLVNAVKKQAAECEFPDQAKELYNHARSLESKARTEAVLSLAKAREPLPIKVDELDANPHLLNCVNGTIDSGLLRGHEFGDLITRISPVEYNEKADCDVWSKFLEDTFSGDREMIDFMARSAGYTMTGFTHEQKLFFLYGLGSNGKSVFVETIMAVLGDYARVIPTDVLMAGKDQHPTGLTDLRGTRMAVASEVEDGRRWNEQLIKSITGDGKIVARRMHQDFFEFESRAKLWVMGNHKPVLRGTDYAIRRRFLLIPFLNIFSGARKDAFLKDKLRKELPGILAWMVRGYNAWLQRGLDPPQKVLEATDNYFEEMDVLQSFINDECEVGTQLKETQKILYARYCAVMKDSNEYIHTSTQFAKRMKEKGYDKRRGGGNYPTFYGLRLRQEMSQHDKF